MYKKITFIFILIISIFFNSKVTFAREYRPILNPMYPDLLVWKWHHIDPYRWNFYSILSNGSLCILVDDYWKYGADRKFAPDGGSTPMFMVGVDKFGKEITKRSNVVRPDDAPVPPKKRYHRTWPSNDYGACGKRDGVK